MLILAAVPATPVSGASGDIGVLLDGKELTFDVPPIIVEGRTLVPLRAIFEALDAQVGYDDATRTVTATKGSITIALVIGQAEARVGDRAVALSVPAQVVQGRTLVPLRFVAEALGAEVGFDGSTRTVTIQSGGTTAAAAADGAGAAAGATSGATGTSACGNPVTNPMAAEKRRGSPSAQLSAAADESIYMSVSRDGTKWGVVKGLFGNATNSTLTITSTGLELLVWSDWSERAENLASGVSYDGMNWMAKSEGIQGWRGEATGFQAVEVRPGCYRLYFQGQPAAGGNATLPADAAGAIYSAVSQNGLDWVLEQGIRYYAQGSADPFVLRVGSGWRMYLTQRSGNDEHIISAGSADGLSFTAEQGVRAAGVSRPAAEITSDGKVRLYAHYADGVLQSYVSSDGLALTGEAPSRPGGRSVAYMPQLRSYHRLGAPSPLRLASVLREPDPNAPKIAASCGQPTARPFRPQPRRTSSDFPRSGPYYDRVRQATSADGITWTPDSRTLFEHLSVPDVTLAADGRLLLFAVDFSSYTENLAMAESRDFGKTWSALKEVQVWGWDGKAVDPDIAEVAPGCFRLTFFGMDGSMNPSHGEPHKMYSAVGHDGLNFVLEEGVRMELPNAFDPDIVKVGNTWRMYLGYTIGEGPGSSNQTISASSQDGIQYTLDEEVRAQGSIPNAITMPDGSVTLRTVGAGGIPIWTSRDGLSFTQTGVSYGVAGADPSVVRLPDGRYFMIYKDFMPR